MTRQKLDFRLLGLSIGLLTVVGCDVNTVPTSTATKAETGSASNPVLSDPNVHTSVAPVKVGQAAPDFSVTSFDGHTQRLSAFKGHPVYIDFWATWCPPCLEGLPHTQLIFKQGAPQGLKVMAICDEERAPVEALFKKEKYNFPAYMDSTHKMGPKYGIDYIPVVVVIDKNGNLVDYIVGGNNDERILAALKKVGVTITAP